MVYAGDQVSILEEHSVPDVVIDVLYTLVEEKEVQQSFK